MPKIQQPAVSQQLAGIEVKPSSSVLKGSSHSIASARLSMGALFDRLIDVLANSPQTGPLAHKIRISASGRRHGRDISAAEITAALKREFPHRHQVLVAPMRSFGEVEANVMKAISYSSKAFSDFGTERVVEIARALNAIGRRSLLFSRRWGVRSGPSARTEIGAGPKVRGNPQPESSNGISGPHHNFGGFLHPGAKQ
jgi:hypothetical protein